MATRISKQKLQTAVKILGMFMSERIATYQTSTRILGYTQNGKQSHECAQKVAVALRSGSIVYVVDDATNRVLAWIEPTAQATVKVHREPQNALKSAKQTKAAKATAKQSKAKAVAKPKATAKQSKTAPAKATAKQSKTAPAKATAKQSKAKPKARWTTYKGRRYYSAPVGRTPKEVEEARAQCWLNSSAKTYKERVRLQQKMREFSDEADLAWLLNGAN